MHQTAYEACQHGGGSTRRDGYYQWVTELHHERLARIVDGELAVARAQGVNALTGEPLGPWFDLFWGES